MLAAAVVMTVLAVLAVAAAGPQPPRLALTGPAWQWVGSSTGPNGTPLVAPDPAAYTIDFAGDRTFAASADCVRVSGTYLSVPAGRAGGATNSLTLLPAPGPSPAASASCGPASLADAYLAQLASASHYAITGSQLTITLAPQGTMTFQAAPAASSTPGS